MNGRQLLEALGGVDVWEIAVILTAIVLTVIGIALVVPTI